MDDKKPKLGPLDRFWMMQLDDDPNLRIDLRDLSGTQKRFTERFKKYELDG